MKLPTKINPAHCASNDKSRYVLNGVALKGDLAIATDGRVLFVSTLTREDDDSKRDALVPVKAIHAERKGKTDRNRVLPLMTIKDRAGETDPLTVEVMHDRNEVTRFGDVAEAEKFPNFTQCMTEPMCHTLKLCLDMKLLAKLAKSFGDNMLVLHLDPDRFGMSVGPEGYHAAAYVTAQGQPEAFGVIMPARPKSELSDNQALAAAMALREKESAEKPTTTTP